MGVKVERVDSDSVDRWRRDLPVGHRRELIGVATTTGIEGTDRVAGDGVAEVDLTPLPATPADPRQVIDDMVAHMAQWMATDPAAIDKAAAMVKSLPQFAGVAFDDIRAHVRGFLEEETRRIVEEQYRTHGFDRGMTLDLPGAG